MSDHEQNNANDGQSRLTVGLGSAPVSVGDKFEYLGVTMVCLSTQQRFENYLIDSVIAHYFDGIGLLRECNLPHNVWPVINKLPNVQGKGRGPGKEL